jgi:hypothetical protein
MIHHVWPIAKPATVYAGAAIATAHTTHVRLCRTTPNTRAIRAAVVGRIVITCTAVIGTAVTIGHVGAVLAKTAIARALPALVQYCRSTPHSEAVQLASWTAREHTHLALVDECSSIRCTIAVPAAVVAFADEAFIHGRAVLD